MYAPPFHLRIVGAFVMPETREVAMRKATREAGPATATDDDDTPTRDDLIEALGNLRAESDRTIAEWRGANSREARDRAWKRWNSLHAHMDNLCEGVDMIDAGTL